MTRPVIGDGSVEALLSQRHQLLLMNSDDLLPFLYSDTPLFQLRKQLRLPIAQLPLVPHDVGFGSVAESAALAGEINRQIDAEANHPTLVGRIPQRVITGRQLEVREILFLGQAMLGVSFGNACLDTTQLRVLLQCNFMQDPQGGRVSRGRQ